MLTQLLAERYAEALYDLAVEKQMLEQVEAQLRLVEDTVTQHADLATLLYHPRVPAEAKKETIDKVFAGELLDFVRNFLLLLVDKRRETILPAIIREYIRLANEARNIVEAKVTTALPLTDDQQQALVAKLSKLTGKNVIVKAKVDEAILGGVIVQVGSKLIDGSVVRQLANLKTALISAK